MSEGIWGHSGFSGGESYLIATPDNDARGIMDVQDWFRDNVPVKDGSTGYKLVYGLYEGVREQSILFNARLWSEDGVKGGIDTDKVKGLWGFFKKQKEVLLLGPADARDNRPATLLRVCTCCPHLFSPCDIGKFTEVTKETALEADGYTYDPRTGRFYTCVLP